MNIRKAQISLKHIKSLSGQWLNGWWLNDHLEFHEQMAIELWDGTDRNAAWWDRQIEMVD